MKNYLSLVEANYSTVKSDDCFTLKSKDSYYQSSSSPVEASNSKSTAESCSSSAEAKKLNKIGSVIEPNYPTVKLNDCVDFETKSDHEIMHSNVDLKCLSPTVEERENTKSLAPSCSLPINDEQFILSEEHPRDCDIYMINYGRQWHVLVNLDNHCDPHLALCSALMNTFTTYKHAIVIIRNVCIAIFCEPNGSFYVFEPSDGNCNGVAHCNERATVFKFVNLSALETFLRSLANGLSCESFHIIPAKFSNLCQDNIIQKQIIHKERFSRAMFKVFPKSFYKRKSKRQREPSRIPMRKLLNRFKKRCFRKPMKRFILQNIPSSSNLHN